MTFEEAGQQYLQLRTALGAGSLTIDDYNAAIAQLRVQDATGQWWQIDPADGAWLFWNGQAWARPAAPPPPPPPPARIVPAPVAGIPAAQPVNVPRPLAPRSGARITDSLISLLPGIGIQFFQHSAAYRANPAAAARFLLPCLLSVVSVALAPRLGRWVAVLVIIPSLGYLLWPMVGGFDSQAGASGLIQTQAGRGLAGMSLFYMLMNLMRTSRRRF
ncbi:MAG: hypothetical protein ACE15E_19285 [Acidobacteriota bacterium]